MTRQSLLLWAPLSPQQGLSLGWKITWQVSQLLWEEVELDWLSAVSREWLRFGFSWLHSLYSVYPVINYGFQIGLPCQQDWFKKAEVLDLGFFHAYLVIFSRKVRGWTGQRIIEGPVTWLISAHLSWYKCTRCMATEVDISILPFFFFFLVSIEWI
jgi:hypothetical protein